MRLRTGTPYYYKEEWKELKSYTFKEMGKAVLDNSDDGAEVASGQMELLIFLLKIGTPTVVPVVKGAKKFRRLRSHPLYVLHRVTPRNG